MSRAAGQNTVEVDQKKICDTTQLVYTAVQLQGPKTAVLHGWPYSVYGLLQS